MRNKVLKKHIPAICVVVFLVALAAGIPALRVVFAHASAVNGRNSVPDSLMSTTPLASSSATVTATTTATATVTATTTPTVTATDTESSMSYVPACAPVPSGFARCLAMVSTTTVQPTFAVLAAHTNLATGGGVAAPAALPTGSAAPYSPAALHNAYNLPTMATSMQTIGIVDAFDNPNAESDLATYRSMFGLPACTTANGCFSKVNQTGGTTYPTANASWGVEISLDLDMASAICQNCHILLVEASSASSVNLGTAVNEAAALGANEISNSYGSLEAAGENANCSAFYTHPGVAMTASSGDAGPAINFPANCPDVTGVGGTTLNPNGTETAWNTSATRGAGGGCSAQIAIPTWQVPTVTNCANRAVSDVSADADPNTGVFIFDSAQGGGLQVGGTSASAPIIAATFALAGGTAGNASSALIPWMKSNAGCLNVVGGVPYAFQTGLGSPNGITCF
jgi:subtilase family serine protease